MASGELTINPYFMRYLLRIVRPINLLIIAVSQWLIYFLFAIPLFESYSIERVLTGALVPLFILVTTLIAAGSYVVNDLMDLSADQLNKPNKTYIAPQRLSRQTAWVYYGILTVVGAALAIYIALTIYKPLLFAIYPVAVGLLYLYSAYWKRRPLSGNIVVATFCAFVPGIIWYAESEGIALLHKEAPAYTLLFAAYILFGFLATMVREIVKDIEDLAGDKAADYHTYAIVHGPAAAQKLAVFLFAICISTYGLWLLALWRIGSIIGLSIFAVTLLLPSLFVLGKLVAAQSTDHYTLISSYLKWLMVGSLVVFCVVLL